MQRLHWLFFATVALLTPLVFFLAVLLVPDPTSPPGVIGAGALLVGMAVATGLTLGIRSSSMGGRQ